MKKNPKVSIIIPMYGVEKYLRRCLDSVLNQTFTDWQAICVNDGSPDRSGDIAHEYAAHDERFIVIDKENGGVSDARNVGMQHATGDYILFVDSDDFIHCQLLELTYALAMRDCADMVVFNHDVRAHNALKKLMQRGHDISAVVPAKVNVRYNKVHSWTTENVIFHATEKNRSWCVRRPVRRYCYPVLALYRADVIKKIPFIKGIIMEDFPWWTTVLLARPKTVITKLPLYFYMPNGASILNSSNALRMAESVACGLSYAYELWQKKASVSEYRHFNREFLWPFVIIMVRKVREISDSADLAVAKKIISDLYGRGVFDAPCNRRAKKYKSRIENFIK